MAKILPEPRRTIELTKILDKEIENGCLNIAKNIAKLLRRELTTDEKEKILATQIKKGEIYKARELILCHLPQNIQKAWKIKLIERCAENSLPSYTHDLIKKLFE